LPIEPVKDIDAPFFVAVDEYFRIALRAKHVTALFQLTPQLQVVVYLSVVSNHDLSVFVSQGLRSACYVDDAETDVRQADSSSDIEAVSIWASVPDGGRHAAE
jgi:hypothetical protein